MKLSDYIKNSLGTFDPNPDKWTLEQRLGLEWGKQAFQLEERIEELEKGITKVVDEFERDLHSPNADRNITLMVDLRNYLPPTKERSDG